MELVISEIEAIPLRIPLKESFAINRKTFSEFEKVIVKVIASSGAIGYGEVSVDPAIWGYTLDGTMSLLTETLIPSVIGKPLAPRSARDALQGAVMFPAVGNPTSGAIDMAIYDALGRELGVSVSTLLGGARRTRIPVVFSSIDVCSPAETAERAQDAIDQGFRLLKIKGGVDAEEDVKRMAAVRNAVGEETWIRLDVNEGYPNADVAVQALDSMRTSGVALVEDPLPRTDLHGMRKVVHDSPIPVVMQQGLYGPREAVAAVRYESAHVFNITVQAAGGIMGAAEILTVAEAAAIPTFVGAAADSGIGTAASTHLASVMRKLPYPSDCRFQLRYAADVLTEPMRIEDGFTYVPTGPGLGVDVDAAKLSEYRAD